MKRGEVRRVLMLSTAVSRKASTRRSIGEGVAATGRLAGAPWGPARAARFPPVAS
jgi:hypothetical protein